MSKYLSQAVSNDKNIGKKAIAKPYVKILEEPTSQPIRFWYKSENQHRNVGIPGVNSTVNNKTYPTIKIVNCDGPAIVIVSCFTPNKPYVPHPYNLFGKYCKDGICAYIKNICQKDNIIIFSNINIECVKKEDFENSLDVRKALNVNPCLTSCAYKQLKKKVHRTDLSAVRLCFQVYLEGTSKGVYSVPLTPIVSNPIYNKNLCFNLVIRELCQFSASAAGGDNIILLCEKVISDDIEVQFFEKQNGIKCWEASGIFEPPNVHKQTAIVFKTPKFYKQDLEQPVQVYIQLKRPSDGATSEPLPFQMLPLFAKDPDALRRKRKKNNENPSEEISDVISICSLFRYESTCEC